MIDFLSANIVLVLIIVISAGGLILPVINSKRYAPEVSPSKAVELVNKQGGIFVDVRSKDDFKKGHIGGARSIPAEEVKSALSSLPKDKPVILVDRTGALSRTVSKVLKAEGFTSVFILESGLLFWMKENYPLE